MRDREAEDQELLRYGEARAKKPGIKVEDILHLVEARVRGFLQNSNFTPDSEVKKGDLLFVIEPEPYQITVDRAKAGGIV